jgi:hypothetical protein
MTVPSACPRGRLLAVYPRCRRLRLGCRKPCPDFCTRGRTRRSKRSNCPTGPCTECIDPSRLYREDRYERGLGRGGRKEVEQLISAMTGKRVRLVAKDSRALGRCASLLMASVWNYISPLRHLSRQLSGSRCNTTTTTITITIYSPTLLFGASIDKNNTCQVASSVGVEVAQITPRPYYSLERSTFPFLISFSRTLFFINCPILSA